MTPPDSSMVKLLLRDKQYEVKAGMTLLSALEKSNILPESVIATREGEIILEDEILHEGDVIKLVAVISGGAGIVPDRKFQLKNNGNHEMS